MQKLYEVIRISTKTFLICTVALYFENATVQSIFKIKTFENENKLKKIKKIKTFKNLGHTKSQNRSVGAKSKRQHLHYQSCFKLKLFQFLLEILSEETILLILYCCVYTMCYLLYKKNFGEIVQFY